MNKFKSILPDLRYIQLIPVLCILYITPIVLANYLFIDDIARSYIGYSDMVSHGRLVAHFLFILQSSFENVIVNIYPFSQIISALVFGLAGLIISIQFSVNPNSYRILFTTLSFLVFPFTLENLSYQFDSIPMSFSVLFIAGAFYYSRGVGFHLILSCLFLFLSMLCYQSAIGLYIGLCSFKLYLSIRSNKTVQKEHLYCYIKNIIVFMFASIVYIFLIGNVFIKENDWAKQAGERIAFDVNFINNVFNNARFIYEALYELLINNPSGALLLIVIILVLSKLVFNILLFIYKAEYLSALLCILAVIAIGLSFIFPSFLLRNPIYMPRVYLPMSFLYFIIFYELTSFKKKIVMNISYFLAIYVMLSSFFMMAVYASTLNNQSKFTSYINSTISNILYQANFDENAKLTIVGSSKNAPAAANTILKYRLINKLMTGSNTNGANFQTRHRFFVQTGIKLSQFTFDEQNGWLRLNHNLHFSIYNKNNYYVVKFNNK